MISADFAEHGFTRPPERRRLCLCGHELEATRDSGTTAQAQFVRDLALIARNFGAEQSHRQQATSGHPRAADRAGR